MVFGTKLKMSRGYFRESRMLNDFGHLGRFDLFFNGCTGPFRIQEYSFSCHRGDIIGNW
ncbi:MAG: hypothetical protein ACTSXP_04365 [Promethearchaeota archaeon]